MTKQEYLQKVREFFNTIIGERVEHFSFGEGTIEEIDGDIIFVSYDDSDHLRRFKMESFFLFNSPMNGDVLSEFECIKFEYEQSLKTQKPKKAPKPQVIEDDEPDTKEVTTYINNVTFKDVIGLSDVKDTVNKLIVFPFKYQDIYKAFKRESGGSILLYGAPGCGKTLIVKAIANEVDAQLFVIKCSDIKSKWYGESEQNIKKIFEQARSFPKSIIFFDEFESLGSNRDNDDSKTGDSVVTELLAQIDGFDSKRINNTTLIIAATNKPWNIDSALLRNGRFGKKIFVGLPNREEIIDIIKHELINLPVGNIDYDEIVSDIGDLSAADAVALCNEAKDMAISRSIQNNKIDVITTEDFINARAIVRSTINAEELKRLKNFTA